MLCTEEVTEDEIYKAFLAQAKALKAGGADGIVCETFAELAEILVAVRAVKDAGLPVAASMTYDTGPELKTMMGMTAAEAAEVRPRPGSVRWAATAGWGLTATSRWPKSCASTPTCRFGPSPTPACRKWWAARPSTRKPPRKFAGKIHLLLEAGANFVGGRLRNFAGPYQQSGRSGEGSAEVTTGGSRPEDLTTKARRMIG